MLESDVIAYIRKEISRQMNVILSGQSGTNDQFFENIENMFPGMSTINSRPVMHPYGVVSRAPRGTFQVNGRQGDHFGNRVVLGHRDQNRPALAEGEVFLYNQFGQQIRLENGMIRIGDAETTDPAVVGNELKAMLQDLITLISTHTHVGNLGSPTTPPIEAGEFVDIQADNVDNDLILSQLVTIKKG